MRPGQTWSDGDCCHISEATDIPAYFADGGNLGDSKPKQKHATKT